MRVHYVNIEPKFDIAYFPNTKRFFRINDKGKQLINAIVEGISESKIMKTFDITEEEYKMYLKNTQEYEAEQEEKKDVNHSICSKKVLPRLVIHVTNDCNLRCQYCYANGGIYLSDSGKLSEDTLDLILKRFYGEFDEIQTIQFFGGEPLLNISLIEKACEKIKQIDEKRGYKTYFGIVTNGTLIDDKFIDIVNKYNLGVTISYDGNPKINDITRINKNGRGTSAIILKNAKYLKAKTGQPTTIEVTYNQYHIDNNVSILDVVRHIQNEIPDTYIHLVPAGGNDDCGFTINNLDVFADSIYEIFGAWENIKEGEKVPSYSLADRIFAALTDNQSKGSPYICDAGIGTISVSIRGDVYPCFMFTDQKELKLGNIKDEKLFISSKYKEIRNKLFSFSTKENNPECRECFINTLCNGCLGLNSVHSGNAFKLSYKTCEMFRKMTEAALISYARKIERLKLNEEIEMKLGD